MLLLEKQQERGEGERENENANVKKSIETYVIR